MADFKGRKLTNTIYKINTDSLSKLKYTHKI
jgi:hypothetical protein